LAMAGQTIIGGGTYIGDLIEGTSSYVRRSSRKMREFSGDLSIRKISRYIDDGQPVIWSMSSTKAYNNLANTITNARRGETDPKEWRKSLLEILRETPELENISGYGHVCLIIGYNEKTDEIAVSDSWGPKYELRWLSEDAAARVSNGKFYVVDF
ncbi:MAG: C39 family peptidase, partial [Opitutales bacterium]